MIPDLPCANTKKQTYFKGCILEPKEKTLGDFLIPVALHIFVEIGSFTYPLAHEHLNEPTVFWHLWLQLPRSSHSLISMQSLPLRANLWPVLQRQIWPTASCTHLCLQPPLFMEQLSLFPIEIQLPELVRKCKETSYNRSYKRLTYFHIQ